MKNALHLVLVLFLGTGAALAQSGSDSSAFAATPLKYAGGCDWYNDPSSEVNLLSFIHRVTGIETDPRYEFVDIASDELFAHPFLFMTGHGNIAFSEAEARRLRTYLENGGFLYADDDYGMDKSFR